MGKPNQGTVAPAPPAPPAPPVTETKEPTTFVVRGYGESCGVCRASLATDDAYVAISGFVVHQECANAESAIMELADRAYPEAMKALRAEYVEPACMVPSGRDNLYPIVAMKSGHVYQLIREHGEDLSWTSLPALPGTLAQLEQHAEDVATDESTL